MGNECSSRAVSEQAPRTWYELYKDAESTYEIDTSANDESTESLYLGTFDDSDDEISSHDESSIESLGINDILLDSIKYDASGVVNASTIHQQ